MENIIILGFGITGKSTYEVLKNKYNIYVQDDNIDKIMAEEKYQIQPIRSEAEVDDIGPVFVVKSPGINPSNPYVSYTKNKGYQLISDLELAYNLYPNRKIIAITGTNGKTTTTALTGKIFKEAGYTTHVIGNIGKGILPAFDKGQEDDIYLIEASSFQLEDTINFRPNIGVFLNFSPDHLDWHGDLEAYFTSKAKIFANMKETDKLIVNKDSKALERIFSKADVLFTKSDQGDYYVQGEKIKGPQGEILALDDIKLPGQHNLENILAAVFIAHEFGIDKKLIKASVRSFTGIEHRLEFVDEISNVKYYNDSKGTNVDSTIRALESFDEKIILIAGGYDKKIEFNDLMKAAENRVKTFVLIGQTSKILADYCSDYAFEYYITDSMEEAVKVSSNFAQQDDIVLLSPASASWGMYENFEERGKHFKKLVLELRK